MIDGQSNVIDFEAYRLNGQRYRLPELETEPLLYIDWLTITQEHPGLELPLVYDTFTTKADRDGEVILETFQKARVDGSFDNTMAIKCDGHRVTFDGNIARYGRPDNVFGYSWDETIKRVNQLLNLHSLPPFTPGERLRFADKGIVYTGARASRIDITKNYATFSARDAKQLIQILGGHHQGRQKGEISPDGMTVMYGYGSKYASGKCYIKAREIKDNRKKKSGSHVGADVEQWCYELGLVREEFTLKSRFLTQKNLCYIAQIDQAYLEEVYSDRTQLRRLKNMSYQDTTNLSDAARGTLARYEKGEPIELKKTKFYRIRRELINAGYADISVPRNIERLQIPVKVIEIQQLCAPDWYRKKYG